MIVWCLSATRLAGAQATGDNTAEDDSHGSIARLTDLFDDSRPVRPRIGVVEAGSGPAVGAIAEARAVGGTWWGAGVEGMISTRNYQHLLVRSGALAKRRVLVELRSADAPLTSFMRAGRRARGAALFLEHRRRRLPRRSYFALDGDNPLRTDFGLRLTTTDLVAQWALTPRVGLGARVGVLSTSLFAGTDGRYADTHDRFGAALGEEQEAATRYVTVALGALLDLRDDAASPGAGWMVQVAGTGFVGATSRSPSFVRLALDARLHRRVATERHVLSLRALVASDLAAGNREAPYFLQQTLGGSSTLRAYDSYRLRGARLLHATVESRWRVAPFLEAVPFVDVGRVTRRSLDSGLNGWLVTPGAGLRVRYGGLVVGRFDVARGRDGYRVSYGFDSSF